MEPKVLDLIQYGFYGLMSLVTSYGVAMLSGLKTSVEKLNVNMAVIIQKTATHEKELDKHDSRLTKLEQN